ncbi:MAG: histidine kinase [Flavobacteriales bacterium]|nr:histidine kinase [Flavobacteriales bacterium]
MIASRGIRAGIVIAVVLVRLQAPGQDHRVEQLKELRARGEHAPLETEAKRLLADAKTKDLRYEAEYHWAFARSGKDDPLGAVEHAQKALLVARGIADTSRVLASLYQLTKFNVEGRHFEEADRFRREHLALARAYGRDTIQQALALNSMGSMYSRIERPDSEEYCYREGLKLLGDSKHVVKQALLGNLASTLSAKGEHAEAAKLHEQVLAELDSTDLHNKAWTLSNLGRSLMYAKRYPEALAAFDTGDSLNAASGNALDLAIDLAELRAECLEAMGDITGAYAMIRRARDLQDTLFDRSMNEQYLELEKRFETQLKEEEIQRLDAQAREQDERLRLRNVQLYGSLALAVLALSAALLVWRNLRQKRQYSATLEKLNAELSEQKTRIEEINRLLQLKVLRTQMNPHFIYNSLNAIHNLVRKGEAAAASAYLDGFARLLRMVLDHSVKERVPLADEIAFLRQYLKLEAMRFEDGLEYVVDADRALLDDEDLLVPTLLVQPFVENAVWHGLAPKQGEKKLSVRFAMRGDQVVCTVEENGVGRDAAPKRTHPDGSASLGLQLTNERLQLLAFKLGDTGRVKFTDLMEAGAPAGTRVEVLLG